MAQHGLQPMPRPARRRRGGEHGLRELVSQLGCDCWCKVLYEGIEGVLAVTDHYIMVCRVTGEAMRWVHKNDVKGVELTRQGTLSITPSDAADDPSPLTIDTRPFMQGEGDPALRIYQEIMEARRPRRRVGRKVTATTAPAPAAATQTKEAQTFTEAEVLKVVESSPVRAPVHKPPLTVVERTLHQPLCSDLQAVEATLREELTTLRTDINVTMTQMRTQQDAPESKEPPSQSATHLHDASCSPDARPQPAANTNLSPSSGPWFEDETPSTASSNGHKSPLWDWAQDSEASPYMLNQTFPRAAAQSCALREVSRAPSAARTGSKPPPPRSASRSQKASRAPSDVFSMGPFLEPTSSLPSRSRSSAERQKSATPMRNAYLKASDVRSRSGNNQPPSIEKEASGSSCSMVSFPHSDGVSTGQQSSPWGDVREGSAKSRGKSPGVKKQTSNSDGVELWDKMKGLGDGRLRPSKGPWEVEAEGTAMDTGSPGPPTPWPGRGRSAGGDSQAPDSWPYHKPSKSKKPPPRRIPTPSNPESTWAYHSIPTPFPSLASVCP